MLLFSYVPNFIGDKNIKTPTRFTGSLHYSFSKGTYNILFNAYGYDSYSSVKDYYSATLTVSDGRIITKEAECINNNHYYYVTTDTKGDTSKEYIYVKEDGGINKMYEKKGAPWEKIHEKSSDALYKEDKNEWYLWSNFYLSLQ